MHNEQREQFEKWLRTVCFQQPTPEAHDLAWQAWKAAQHRVQPTCSTCGAKLRSGDIWWNECENCHSKIASG